MIDLQELGTWQAFLGQLVESLQESQRIWDREGNTHVDFTRATP
jgi:hypothetical protein